MVGASLASVVECAHKYQHHPISLLPHQSHAKFSNTLIRFRVGTKLMIVSLSAVFRPHLQLPAPLFASTDCEIVKNAMFHQIKAVIHTIPL